MLGCSRTALWTETADPLPHSPPCGALQRIILLFLKSLLPLRLTFSNLLYRITQSNHSFIQSLQVCKRASGPLWILILRSGHLFSTTQTGLLKWARREIFFMLRFLKRSMSGDILNHSGQAYFLVCIACLYMLFLSWEPTSIGWSLIHLPFSQRFSRISSSVLCANLHRSLSRQAPGDRMLRFWYHVGTWGFVQTPIPAHWWVYVYVVYWLWFW